MCNSFKSNIRSSTALERSQSMELWCLESNSNNISWGDVPVASFGVDLSDISIIWIIVSYLVASVKLVWNASLIRLLIDSINPTSQRQWDPVRILLTLNIFVIFSVSFGMNGKLLSDIIIRATPKVANQSSRQFITSLLSIVFTGYNLTNFVKQSIIITMYLFSFLVRGKTPVRSICKHSIGRVMGSEAISPFLIFVAFFALMHVTFRTNFLCIFPNFRPEITFL